MQYNLLNLSRRNKRSVTTMSKQEFIKITREREKELNNILIDSSLYLGMSPAERRKLLHHLVSSYFNRPPVENSRALSMAM
jgi:hypothetical protein